MRPVIGIITARKENGTLAVPVNYVHAVERAGGLALLLGVTGGADAAGQQQWMTLGDCFLLTGGGDVAPSYYGQSPLPCLGETDRLRDCVEFTLCRMAEKAGKPVLGICRGIQAMNVAFGGTLWQDIEAQCRGAIGHAQKTREWGELYHSIALAPNSQLASIMGGAQQECDSFHHQAVRDVAPGFFAVAHSPDGVVEAIENEAGTMLGVEWHPERLSSRYPAHAAIFNWLVQQAGEHENE